MRAISYPLRIVNGDLAIDYTPTQVIRSEILAILETRFGDRPFRQSYGSKNYVLKKLDLSDLITSISVALETNLALLGFSAISVEIDSDLQELQGGVVNLLVKYNLNGNVLNTNYSIQLRD
jgi:phage baseplate assembly protein W